MSPVRMPLSGCASGRTPGSLSSAITTGSISVTGATTSMPPPARETWCHRTTPVAASHSVTTFVAPCPAPNAPLRAAQAFAATIASSGDTDAAKTPRAIASAINVKMLFFMLSPQWQTRRFP